MKKITSYKICYYTSARYLATMAFILGAFTVFAQTNSGNPALRYLKRFPGAVAQPVPADTGQTQKADTTKKTALAPADTNQPGKADTTGKQANQPIKKTAKKAAPTPAELAAKDTTRSLLLFFSQKDIILEQEDIVTNVMILYNHTSDAIDFSVQVNAPYNWTDLNYASVKYHLNTGDSIFIPVRVIPTEIKGGAEYVINAYVVSGKDGSQLASGYFFAHTKRIVRWDMNVLPGPRIYFMNGQDTASFSIKIANEGNEPDDLLLTLKNQKKTSILMDSTGRVLHNNFYNTQLKPLHDTILPFKIKYVGNIRNQKYADLEEYSPVNKQEPQDFSVWTTTQETKQTDSSRYMKGKEITFIKLTDITRANPFGGQTIPLTMDLNGYNVFGPQPVVNLNLYGNTLLNNDAHLFYATSFYYSTYYWQNSFFKSAYLYGAYFDKRGDDVQVGDVGSAVSSGLSVGGKGIKGDYIINHQSSVGGLFAESYGNTGSGAEAWYKYRFLNLTPILNGQIFTTNAGMYINNRQNVNDYFISESGGVNVTNTQHLSFAVSGIEKAYANKPFLGGSYRLNYIGNFLNGRLNQSNYFYRGSYDTLITSKSIMGMGNYTNYKLNKIWYLQLQNQYTSYQTPYYTVTPVNFAWSNYLYAVKSSKNNGVMPFAFFNRYNSRNIKLAYFGLGQRYNYYNNDMNVLLEAGIQGGYNHLLNYPDIKDYFTVQPNLFLRYHTTTFRAYYSYGPLGVPDTNTLTGLTLYPQEITLSLNKQYQFSNTHFILDNALYYSYYNVYYDHSFTYSPEFYYFSNNGWRFRIGLDYTFNSSNVGKYSASLYQVPTETENNTTAQVSNNIYLNFGLKKQFGIPIPKKWTKLTYKNIVFIAFLDLNGDGKKEYNEAPVDNVVVHLGDSAHVYEALTNDDGEARILNIRVGKYYQMTTPLRNMKEWFNVISDTVDLNTKDTIFVPFVRGVKVLGSVVYHPAKYSVYPHIDLAGIQITATDANGKPYSTLTNPNGEYTLYVPIGKYTISMNEDWMDGRFVVAQNNFPVTLNPNIESIYQSFYVTEKSSGIDIQHFSQPSSTPTDEAPHH